MLTNNNNISAKNGIGCGYSRIHPNPAQTKHMSFIVVHFFYTDFVPFLTTVRVLVSLLVVFFFLPP